MDEQELLDAVAAVARPGGRELVCGRPGHQAGHVCLTVPGTVDLSVLLKEFNRRHGQLRNLAMGGYVDPTVTERTGLPLLAPFAGELVEMRAWASGSRWIGCGAVRAGDGEQLVVLVAERAAPSPDAPPEGDPWADSVIRVPAQEARDAARPGTRTAAEAGRELPEDPCTWAQRVIELTGWKPLGISADWPAIEEELGVPLPADYKKLYEAFGGGVFSESVYFLGRDEGISFDLLTQWRVAVSADRDSALGSVSALDPYGVYPRRSNPAPAPPPTAGNPDGRRAASRVRRATVPPLPTSRPAGVEGGEERGGAPATYAALTGPAIRPAATEDWPGPRPPGRAGLGRSPGIGCSLSRVQGGGSPRNYALDVPHSSMLVAAWPYGGRESGHPFRGSWV
ncbi:SMI1/KNR4 family protein [Streptomyces sp. NPDC052644]